MTTPTGPFADVEINIRFSDYPPDKRISQLFNETYRDTLPDVHQLFVDENHLETVKPDSELLLKMQELVVEKIFKYYASQTIDYNIMDTLIKQASFKIGHGNNKVLNRLSAQNLTNALKASVTGANPTNCVDVVVGIARFHFDTSNGMINFLDWSKISNRPFTGVGTYPLTPLAVPFDSVVIPAGNAKHDVVPIPAPGLQNIATPVPRVPNIATLVAFPGKSTMESTAKNRVASSVSDTSAPAAVSAPTFDLTPIPPDICRDHDDDALRCSAPLIVPYFGPGYSEKKMPPVSLLLAPFANYFSKGPDIQDDPFWRRVPSRRCSPSLPTLDFCMGHVL